MSHLLDLKSSNNLTQLRSGGMRSTFQILALFLSVVFLTVSDARAEVYFNHALSSNGGTAEQISNYRANAGLAPNAIDGNTNGVWSGGSVTHTGSAVVGNWWQVNLGSIRKIDKIEIYNRSDDCCIGRLREFYIFISGQEINEQGNSDEGINAAKAEVAS